MPETRLTTRASARTANFGMQQHHASCKSFQLRRGLYVIRVPAFGADKRNTPTGLPVAMIARMPHTDAVEILSGDSWAFEWIGAQGGATVVRVNADTASILLIGLDHRQVGNLPLRIMKIDEGLEAPASRSAGAFPPSQSAVPSTGSTAVANRASEPAVLALLHIENVGDKTFFGGDWMGDPDGRRRIEGFSLRAEGSISNEEIEYRATTRRGQGTRWLSGSEFCGTRGRRQPLVGFAVRLHNARFDVSYRGTFLSGYQSQPVRDGALCTSDTEQDPLVAMWIQFAPRSKRAQAAPQPAPKPMLPRARGRR